MFQQEGFIGYDEELYGGTYYLTPSGIAAGKNAYNEISKTEQKKVDQVKRTFNLLPLNQLLFRVYSDYPEYTKNSLIRDEVLRNPDEQ